MRVIGILAAVLLAGCSAQADATKVSDKQLTRVALKAYRDGDRARLHEAVEQYEQLTNVAAPADPCSAEAGKLRRMGIVHEMLADLDNPTLMSMSEEARLIFLQRRLQGGDIEKADEYRAAEDACNAGSEGSTNLNDLKMALALVSFAKGVSRWQEELERGGDFPARAKAAEALLEQNGLDG